MARTRWPGRTGSMPVVEPDTLDPKRAHLVGIVTETDIFALIADAWRADQALHA